MGFSAIYFSHKYLLIRNISGKCEKIVQQPFNKLQSTLGIWNPDVSRYPLESKNIVQIHSLFLSTYQLSLSKTTDISK